MTDFSIANIHSTNGEYDKALQLHKKCIEIYKRMNIFSNEISKIYLNMIWINILIDHYSEALEIIENLEDDILECLKNRDEFKLYKIIVFLHFGRNDEAFELCKDIKRNYKKDNIAHNFIMYYYHINGTKNIRMKYLNNINILVAQSTNYSTYRLLFKLLRNECTSEKQLAEFNDLMYQYIFNLFN